MRRSAGASPGSALDLAVPGGMPGAGLPGTARGGRIAARGAFLPASGSFRLLARQPDLVAGAPGCAPGTLEAGAGFAAAGAAPGTEGPTPVLPTASHAVPGRRPGATLSAATAATAALAGAGFCLVGIAGRRGVRGWAALPGTGALAGGVIFHPAFGHLFCFSIGYNQVGLPTPRCSGE